MKRHDKDCLLLALTGTVVALGYGLCSIDFGGVKLSHSEAWTRWVAQPYVFSGAILVLFSSLLHNGYSWVSWPIFFWGPSTLVFGIGSAVVRGIGTLDLLDAIHLFLLFGIWFWGTWDILQRRNEITPDSAI